MSRDLTVHFPIEALPVRPPQVPRTRGAIVAGIACVTLFIGGFGAWAGLAPLTSAAVAHGQIKVEGNRKTVQHLEGGIIHEILVREGDVVRQGQVLMRLDDTQSSASADAFRGQDDALRALDARLKTERDGRDQIAFPPDLTARRAEPRVAEILTGQETIFANRRTALASQLKVLQEQIQQSEAEIESYRAQVESLNRQLGLIREEIKGVQALYDKGLERKPRLLSLQRDEATISGNLGQQQALIARARQAIAETQAKIAQLQDQRQSEVALEQRDVQSRLVETQEHLRAAADVEARQDIVAPIGGTVVNLRYFTTGGVVRAGDPILDIVPNGEPLVIEAQVQTTDIDVVHVGLPAEIRLTAYKQRVVPVLQGKVTYVSADSLVNERTGQPYFKAEVEIDRRQLADVAGVALQPGMPAEVVIVAGERTMLQYLVTPVLDSFHRAFHEQ